MAVTAHVVSCMVGCGKWVAATYAVISVVGYCPIVPTHAMSCATLGMLSQFGCCIRDAAAAAMAAPPKIPQGKSKGLVDRFLLFSFLKGEPKSFFVLFGLI